MWKCLHKDKEILAFYVPYRNFGTSLIRFKDTYYEVLELRPGAPLKDIKLQFKKMSKKYHPDMNSHLSKEEQETKKDRFLEIVDAYETLKNPKLKREYDQSLKNSGSGSQFVDRDQQWRNNYYGEAKYYSKADSSSASGSRMNKSRHRVSPSSFNNKSAFSGMHKNYGDRDSVPHFNYKEHLSKHLKFEQRMINKTLSESERAEILRQLSKSGKTDELDEELITKHLMRRAQSMSRSGFTGSASAFNGAHEKRIMYEHPVEERNTFKNAMILACASATMYVIYQALAG